MHARLTSKAIFFHPETWLLLAAFFAIRIGSFIIADLLLLQAILVFLLVMLLGLLYFKNEGYAWMIVLGELLIGGSGHFIEFYGLPIRTILIITFLLLWFSFTLSNQLKKHELRVPHGLFWAMIPIFLWAVAASFVALFNLHAVIHIVEDFVPYVFLLLLLPAYHLFKHQRTRRYLIRLLVVFIIGSAFFSLITFIGFVSGIHEMHGAFYEWFTNIGLGEITPLTPFFYSISLPEHLLIPPAALIILSLLMRDEKHHKMWRFLFILCGLTVMLSMSGIFFIGTLIGGLFLLYKHSIASWVKECVWGLVSCILIFVGINVVASFGTSMGFELLTTQLKPSTTQMQLLQPIANQIQNHPVIGNGLGSELLFTTSKSFSPKSTNQFEWGYLEMWAELGIIGLAIFAIALIALFAVLVAKIQKIPDWHDLKVGLFGGLAALLFINILTPALYTTYGILFLTFVAAFTAKPVEFHDEVVTLLYQIFNKSKKIAH